MALSYNLGYQEIISVHPTRRQIFAGKPYSTSENESYMNSGKIVAGGRVEKSKVLQEVLADLKRSLERAICIGINYVALLTWNIVDCILNWK